MCHNKYLLLNRRPADLFHKGSMTWNGTLAALASKAQKQQAYLKTQQLAIQQVEALVPPNASFILVDEDQWDTRSALANRKTLPFLEHEGRYWGPPPDDETAIRDLERLRQSGANLVVFALPALWWLEYYGEFGRHLYSNFHCVLHNERLVVFDLR